MTNTLDKIIIVRATCYVVAHTDHVMSNAGHMTYLKVDVFLPGQLVDSFVLKNSVTMANSFCSKLFNCLIL